MLNILATSSIGIDVTDEKLRLVSLSRKGKNIILEDFNEISLPEGIIADGEIKDKKRFSENLSGLISGSANGKKINFQIISSIPEKDTFTILIDGGREIRNEKKDNDGKNIPEIILSEIKDQVPVPIEEIYLDWQVTGKNKILISASPKNVVDNYTDSFKCCGHLLSAIDIKAAAIIRAVISAKNSENKLIVHIGESSSTIILGGNDSIEFTMNIPFGDKLANNLIEEKLKLSKAQVQKAKKTCGLSDKKCHGALKKVLEPHIKEVTDSIKNVILYHKENFAGDKPIDKIILCGEGANLKDMEKIVSQNLKVESVIANPLINIINNNNSFDSRKALKFTAAIGMALRGVL